MHQPESHFLPFLLCQSAGIALFAAGWFTAAKGPRWALVTAGVALTMLLGKMVLAWKPIWEAELFPWPGYVFLHGFWPYLITLLFFGLAIAQLPVRWNRMVVGGIAAVVFSAGLVDSWWMITPTNHGEEQGAGPDHHYRQTTAFTCAPSACVTALSYVDVYASEREMATLCLTHATGTTTFNTYRGLSLKLDGTAYRARIVARSAEELGRPGVTAVIGELPGFHAIAVHGVDGAVTVHDPMALKAQKWSVDQLRERYDGPVAVVIERVP